MSIGAATFRAFVKYAGVGWDIHGYREDPSGAKVQKLLEKKRQEKKEWDEKHLPTLSRALDKHPYPSRPKPGILRQLVGAGTSRKQQRKYQQQVHEVSARRAQAMRSLKHLPPSPEEDFEVVHGLRRKTPFDEESSRGYKLHSIIGVESGLDDLTTDEVYSRNPTRRSLSKKQLRDVMDKYEKGLSFRLSTHEDPETRRAEQQAGQAFLNKAKHLLKDKDTKVVRLEYE